MKDRLLDEEREITDIESSDEAVSQGRMPSMCNSEILSQKYDGGASNGAGASLALEDPENPYEASYDLSAKAGLESTRVNRPGNQFRKDTNRSVGTGQASHNSSK